MNIRRNVFVRSIALAALALAFSPVFTALQVNASQGSQCQVLIAELRADTEGVVIVGKNAEKNRAGLIGKLDAASASLDRGKLCDAIRKLTDFRNKVNQLIASGSINSDPAAGVTGQDLVNSVDEAIACVQAQAAQSGITCTL